MAEIKRRKTFTASINGVRVGSSAPVMVQSMTNTDTADIPGPSSRSPRWPVPAAKWCASPSIMTTQPRLSRTSSRDWHKQGLRAPIIGDFHYNGHLLLTKYPECAEGLAKYRINPGNASIGRKNDDNFRTMIEVAVKYQKPVRIGVNWGSLDQALLTR